MKTKLQTKLASKREVEIAKSEAKGKELAEAVLGKLLQLKGGVVPEDVEVTEPSQEEESSDLQPGAAPHSALCLPYGATMFTLVQS